VAGYWPEGVSIMLVWPVLDNDLPDMQIHAINAAIHPNTRMRTPYISPHQASPYIPPTEARLKYGASSCLGNACFMVSCIMVVELCLATDNIKSMLTNDKV
jgi:hypothetical protein